MYIISVQVSLTHHQFYVDADEEQSWINEKVQLLAAIDSLPTDLSSALLMSTKLQVCKYIINCCTSYCMCDKVCEYQPCQCSAQKLPKFFQFVCAIVAYVNKTHFLSQIAKFNRESFEVDANTSFRTKDINNYLTT